MKKLTIFLAALLVIFSAMSVHSTYAYWNHMSQINATARVSIGNWRDENVWTKGTVYRAGDIVLWNGIYYIALRTSHHKEPGKKGSQNFWEVYTF